MILHARNVQIADCLGPGRRKIIEAAKEQAYYAALYLEQNNRGNVVSGSLDWFIRSPEYSEWQSSNSPSLLWHPGLPGSGKTTLLRQVLVQLLEEQRFRGKRDIAYMFCISGTTSATAVLRSIIGQILNKDHDRIDLVRSSLINFDVAYERIIYQSFALNSDIAQGQLWNLLYHVLFVRPGQETLIFIDAIDEIRDEDRSEFVKNLRSMWDALLLAKIFVVRFLIAGRPYADIQENLDNVPWIDQDTERKR